MAYKISCRGCSRKLRIAKALVERIAMCPACERKFVLHRGKPKANGAMPKADEDMEAMAEQDAEDLAASLLADDEIPDVKPRAPLREYEPPMEKEVDLSKPKPKGPGMYLPPHVPAPTPPARPGLAKKPAAKEEGEGLPTKIKALIGVGGGLIALILVGWFLFGGSGLADVSGKLTLDGEPVAGADVAFLGQAEANQHAFAAKTNPDGTYQLFGHTAGGIPTGKYKVTVTKFVTKGKKVQEAEAAADDLEDGRSKNALPPIYQDAGTTPLQFDVSSGRNRIDLTMKR